MVRTSVRLRKFFDANLAVRSLGRRAAVDLKGEDSASGDLLVTFRVIDCEVIVQPKLDPRPFATNAVIVPLVGPYQGRPSLAFRTGQDLVASTLVVEAAPPAVAHVRLIANDFMMIRDFSGSKLHAGVGLFADQFEL